VESSLFMDDYHLGNITKLKKEKKRNKMNHQLAKNEEKTNYIIANLSSGWVYDY
jgi:hypothetical protein